MTFRNLLREPLVHFLGIGLALFALYALVAPRDSGGERIVISADSMAALQAEYAKLWGRPPTDAELRHLIDGRVRDEILYREGVAMGLDKDDALIKRRVRQKYDLMAEEEDSGDAPTDAALLAFLQANPDRFRAPAIVSFRQVMIPATDTAAEAAVLKARLVSGGATEGLGASSLLPGTVARTPLDLVARDFGGAFADALAAVPVGRWSGPYESAFGSHFVLVSARVPSSVPSLEAVRRDVTREWENDRRTKARDARLAELRERYDVVVEGQPAMPPT